jgi:hypothetical protein
MKINFLLGAALLAFSHAALALLPPAEVECCQSKDYQSDRCRRFTLDAAKCEKVQANWVETYRRISAFQQPPKPAADAAKAPPADANVAKPLTVARVEARLYYAHSGTYSKVIDDKMRFWNVIIGEGGAAEPSKSLRVDVVLKGEPGSFEPEAKVTIDVINAETGKMHTQQSTQTGVLSDKGEYHVTFLLQQTGCIPLRIVARVSTSPATQMASIPFRCGE